MTETRETRYRGTLEVAEIMDILTTALGDKLADSRYGLTLTILAGAPTAIKFELVHDPDWFKRPDPDLTALAGIEPFD